MTPSQVKAEIERMMLASPSPEASAVLSRMPRGRCACGGKLSRRAGRCARCGGSELAQVPRRAPEASSRRERGRETEAAVTVAPGTSAFR